ncbi:MAG: UDP-N-acetylmuramoyl-L-alanine--D-glutamate ligase, partial [Deltaproteobacteria bacterium HGW-Deltaproteobacteria-7]
SYRSDSRNRIGTRMKQNWQNHNILIIGAARQGLAAARYFSAQGAKVTLNDNRSERQLISEIENFTNTPVTWITGGHPLNAVDDKDLVCVSGGVSLDLPIILEAKRRKIPLTNDSQIFMQAVKSPVIGITGSAGKTTTTSLLGEIAKNSSTRTKNVWVGGNIGTPLIEQIDFIEPNDLVILELSSFQLELMTTSPHIAAITNITPNHLDRHKTLESYTSTKARILDFQFPTDIAVLNRDDEGAWNLKNRVKGRIASFGLQKCNLVGNGSYIENDSIFILSDSKSSEICKIKDLKLRGEHNLLNVLAAFTIAHEMGIPREIMQNTIRHFTGVPHRLEFVREVNGVKWFNDSIATAPERTIAAVKSFYEPIVLLLG